MPHIAALLPFSGSTPLSRHCSHQGAEDAKDRALSQTIRYLALLKESGGLTDWEAHERLGIERTSITARRRPLVVAGIVVPSDETRPGPTGTKNTVWRLA